MKRVFALPAVIAMLFGSMTLLAQQPQHVNYRTVTSYNIPPEKEAALLQQANTIGRKIIEEGMTAGNNTTSWTLARVMYRGSPASEFNYQVTVTYNGAPPEPSASGAAARDQIYRKVTGMSYQDFSEKQNLLKPAVGNVLERLDAIAPGSQFKEGGYAAVVRWKITPQRGADYGRYIQAMQLPLNTQALKDGRIVGWNARRVVYPGGADASYDATTTTVYKDLAAALPTAAPGADEAQMQFAKVFPGLSFSAFVDQGRALRRAVRTDLMRVEVRVDRPMTVTSSGR
jgi:hypothetical protein